MPKRVFQKGSRDSNESSITDVLDRLQIPYVKQSPHAGFDLLVFLSPLECWEVKNPEYKWTLTKAEHARREYCKHNGIPYRVIEHIEQVVTVIGERR